MANLPFPHCAGAMPGPRTDFALDRRRFCSVALASLIVPGAAHFTPPDEAPRIVIRDGWILRESDLS